MKERMALIDNSHPLSIRRQAQILNINHSQLYYRPTGEKSVRRSGREPEADGNDGQTILV
ncbi:hypothetical protein GCM10027291_00170 [Telluribacter humicola]